MKYLIRTTTTMKPYNNKNWWIDGDYVKEFTVDANNVDEALSKYVEFVNHNYATISNNAIKKKEPIYIDIPNGVQQIGYCITAKTDIPTDNSYSSQYIDLWVSIFEVSIPKFN